MQLWARWLRLRCRTPSSSPQTTPHLPRASNTLGASRGCAASFRRNRPADVCHPDCNCSCYSSIGGCTRIEGRGKVTTFRASSSSRQLVARSCSWVCAPSNAAGSSTRTEGKRKTRRFAKFRACCAWNAPPPPAVSAQNPESAASHRLPGPAAGGFAAGSRT